MDTSNLQIDHAGFGARPIAGDEAVLDFFERREPKELPDWEYQLRIRDRRGERVIPLERRAYPVGRADDNAIVIDDPAVSEHHLRGWVSRCGFWFVPREPEFPTGNAQNLSCLCLNETLQLGEAVLKVELLQSDAPPQGDFQGIVGRSPKMLALYELTKVAATSQMGALIHGESGSGKEALARALHDLSPWASGPFVPLNCGALTASLAEAELFGVEKGAFTGATHSRPGLFEAAHGGTLFLDEVGELAFELQAKFLRVLQSGELRRVGSTQTRLVQVRVVAATHRDLVAAVKAGRFRGDLYFRLACIELTVPSLAERPGDLARLARFFVRKHAPAGEAVALSDEAMFHLHRHPFPGQVRELETTVARAVAMRRGAPIIEPEHLVLQDGPKAMAEIVEAELPASPHDPGDPAWLYLPGKSKDQIVDEAVTKSYQRHGGDATAAAEELGVHRNTVRNRRIAAPDDPKDPSSD